MDRRYVVVEKRGRILMKKNGRVYIELPVLSRFLSKAVIEDLVMDAITNHAKMILI